MRAAIHSTFPSLTASLLNLLTDVEPVRQDMTDLIAALVLPQAGRAAGRQGQERRRPERNARLPPRGRYAHV